MFLSLQSYEKTAPRWGQAMPFGLPVVPDEYTTYAKASKSSGSVCCRSFYEVGIYSPTLYSHVRPDKMHPPTRCNNRPVQPDHPDYMTGSSNIG